MESNTILLQIATFSGLIGALLTQAMTGLFAYAGDKRKSKLDFKKAFRDKQIEVAENFYFVSGEKMAVVKKNIGFWKDWNNSRSEASLEFLSKEIKMFSSKTEAIDAENWKYNLIALYFDVSLTPEQIITSNHRSKQLYLKVLDITEQVKHAYIDDKEDLYLILDDSITEMCNHYQQLFDQMGHDLLIVKAGFQKQFSSVD